MLKTSFEKPLLLWKLCYTQLLNTVSAKPLKSINTQCNFRTHTHTHINRPVSCIRRIKKTEVQEEPASLDWYWSNISEKNYSGVKSVKSTPLNVLILMRKANAKRLSESQTQRFSHCWLIQAQGMGKEVWSVFMQRNVAIFHSGKQME